MTHSARAPSSAKNRKTATIVAAVVLGMVGMSFAAVPAYKAFCQVTGWGGTTQRAEAEADKVLSRKVTVRFDGTVGLGLPWRFKPQQVSQTLKVGETGLAFYEAENLSDRPVVGRATFNVSPAKAGMYFNKVECFCFTEQLLQPGEKVSMPVTYFIDPKIDQDRNMTEVETITLAYTFFVWEDADIAALDTGQ
ncbi:MAG: cytochrome c oxidase assembly protein [Pseudomonadota bacterium]